MWVLRKHTVCSFFFKSITHCALCTSYSAWNGACGYCPCHWHFRGNQDVPTWSFFLKPFCCVEVSHIFRKVHTLSAHSWIMNWTYLFNKQPDQETGHYNSGRCCLQSLSHHFLWSGNHYYVLLTVQINFACF